MRHIISILVENKFGVLARISGMFSGRGFNIETLNVAPMSDISFSRITATIIGDSNALDQAIKQVSKLINVISVTEYSSGETVERELCLFIIKLDSEQRPIFIETIKGYNFKIINDSEEHLVIEILVKPKRIDALLELIQPYEVIDMARTGGVALKLGK